MICFILIISFLLEISFSNIVNMNSILIPLFTVTSLSLIYPFFKKNKINYFIICLILGLFYDISFADSIFVNTISFCIIGGLVMICYNYVKYNIYTSNIINIIILISYRIISYIILLSIKYISFDSKVFYKGIYSSLLINIIYGIVLFVIIDKLSKMFNKKVVE